MKSYKAMFEARAKGKPWGRPRFNCETVASTQIQVIHTASSGLGIA